MAQIANGKHVVITARPQHSALKHVDWQNFVASQESLKEYSFHWCALAITGGQLQTSSSWRTAWSTFNLDTVLGARSCCGSEHTPQNIRTRDAKTQDGASTKRVLNVSQMRWAKLYFNDGVARGIAHRLLPFLKAGRFPGHR